MMVSYEACSVLFRVGDTTHDLLVASYEKPCVSSVAESRAGEAK